MIIKKTIHIPPHRPEILEYFEYNTTQYKLEGLFRVRTSKSVQELKNSPGFMEFLNTNRIWLKQTEFNSSRCVLIGWLHKSHSYFSRRDDTANELKKRMGIEDNSLFALIPDTLREVNNETENEQERTVMFESLKVEVPVQEVDRVMELFYQAFSLEQDELTEYPITQNMQFVPRGPSQNIGRAVLCKFGMKQNQWYAGLEHHTVRGIKT